MAKIRILIADDHALFRAGLTGLLSTQPDLHVIAEVSSGAEAIQRALELRPDIVLMDITMPDLSGLEATRKIKERNPNIRVLMLTMHEDAGHLRTALRAGISGYVVKSAVHTELIEAIRVVHRGDAYLHPAVAKLLMRDNVERPRKPRAVDPDEEALTPREHEILKLIAEGYTNRQIAEMLHLSIKTVETHRERIMSKLGFKTRAELVRYALDTGLLGPER